MIKYHPNDNTLSEYASGSLDFAASIAVSAHLHFCHKCRQQVEALQTLGGVLMEDVQPVAVDEDLFDKVFDQLDSSPLASPSPLTVRSTDPELRSLPPVVAKLIGDRNKLNWKKLTKSLQIAPLTTGQGQSEVSLHRISAGGKVMEHDHRGSEYTLVLKGSFSDEDGVYQPGDFILKHPGDVHRPYATANRDCICLTVVEKPVSFTGVVGKFINPFLKLNPA